MTHVEEVCDPAALGHAGDNSGDGGARLVDAQVRAEHEVEGEGATERGRTDFWLVRQKLLRTDVVVRRGLFYAGCILSWCSLVCT